MGNVKNFEKLKSSKYYNCNKFYEDYTSNNDFSSFILILESVDIDKIRFKDKKDILKVLEYIFEKYRLYKIKSNYLSNFVFINKYCPFLISEREYIILEFILRLKEQIGGYYLKHYNIFYNIALNYIEHCKRYLIFHKILKDDNIKTLENTDPRFFNFPGECVLNKKFHIEKDKYKNIVM